MGYRNGVSQWYLRYHSGITLGDPAMAAQGNAKGSNWHAAGRSMAQAMAAARRKPGAARAAARSASWASPQRLRAMWPKSPQWIHDWCEQCSGSYERAATFQLPWSAAGLKGS